VKYVPSALAGERVQFVGIGTVDAVVDFSTLGTGAVQIGDDGKSVVVTLPSPSVQDPVLDHEQSHVMNRDRGLLNRIGGLFDDNPTSEASLYKAAMHKMSDSARADRPGAAGQGAHDVRADRDAEVDGLREDRHRLRTVDCRDLKAAFAAPCMIIRKTV
jgi:hypothetical protein